MKYYNVETYDDQSILLENNEIEVLDGKITGVNSMSPNTTYGKYDIDLLGGVAHQVFVDSLVTLPGHELFEMYGLNLSVYQTEEQCLQAVRDCDFSAYSVVRIYGWQFDVMENGLDSLKSLLDTLYPDKPAYAYSNDLTELLCNKAFLSKCKNFLTLSRENHFEGVLSEMQILTLREHSGLLDWSATELREAFLSFQKKYLSAGIVVIRVIACFGNLDKMLDVLQTLEKEGKLILYVGYCVPVNPNHPVERTISDYTKCKLSATKRVFPTHLRIILDGTVAGMTAWLTDPYAHIDDYCGDGYWDEYRLYQLVKQADLMGITVDLQASGDAAAELAAKILSSVMDEHNSMYHNRHCISMCTLMSEYTLQACKAAGIIIIQDVGNSPDEIEYDPLEEYNLGERIHYAHRFGSYNNASIMLASGSCTPSGNYYRPFDIIFILCSRQGREDSTIYNCVQSFCDNAIYAMQLEEKLGDVSLGNDANFTILSKDIRNMQESRLQSVEVLRTVVDGVVVYSNDGE